MRVVPIKGNNGWQECESCSLADSDTCDFCDEADQYEPADQDINLIVQRMELLAA